jgi:hypothetical protein
MGMGTPIVIFFKSYERWSEIGVVSQLEVTFYFKKVLLYTIIIIILPLEAD